MSEQPIPGSAPRGPAAQIRFATVHELEDHLRYHGRRVSRWNVDGSFETEDIPASDTEPTP